MKEIIQSFNVEYLQVLDENGKVDSKLMPSLNDLQIKEIYELMVLTRAFDNKANKLQLQGRMGTFASVRGQEACQIASALLMQKDDLAFPAFREHGVFLARGFSPKELYQYWGGDERGMAKCKDRGMFPVSIPVGSHMLHAVGAGMAFNYLKSKRVAVTYFGDGATSEGDFHEAMNFAGVFNVPCVFICQNNQYAISVPVKEQTASKTLAQKAIAYGFDGIQVDGNDVFAVWKVVSEALNEARRGDGPTFIECFTYRMGNHTTSDEASRYRSEEELKAWEKKDPITRLSKFMLANGICDDSYIESVLATAMKEISSEVDKYEKIPKMKSGEIFDYLYDKPTMELTEQKKKFLGEMK